VVRVPGLIGACLSSPVEAETDPSTGQHNEVDDFVCVDPASSLIFGSLAPLGGCLDADIDFDGVPYHNAWAGTPADPYGFSAVPSPIRFTSPRFKPADNDGDGQLMSYSRAAFEADMPARRLVGLQRHDRRWLYESAARGVVLSHLQHHRNGPPMLVASRRALHSRNNKQFRRQFRNRISRPVSLDRTSRYAQQSER
jgi:hypothetical protein